MNRTQGMLFLGAVTGCMALVVLLVIPAEGGGSALFGFSATRWLLLLWMVAGIFAISSSLFMLRRRPERVESFDQNLLRNLFGWRYWIVLLASVFGVFAGSFFLWVFSVSTNKQAIPLLTRLMPVVLWSAFLCLELVVYLVYFGGREGLHWLTAAVRRLVQKVWMRRSDVISVVLLSAAILVVFGPVFQVVGYTSGSDYYAHVRQAQRMDEKGVNMSSYFLYQMFVISAHTLFPQVDYLAAGIWVVLLFQVFLGWVLYAVLRGSLRRAFENQPAQASALSGLAAFCLLLVTPLNAVTWPSHNMYFGYIGINVYHSPTIVLLKPLALLLFLAAVAVFAAGEAHGSSSAIRSVPFWLTGGITLLCGLAKPNYIISLLPALGLFGIVWLWKRKKIDWLGLVGGIALPAVALLGWQYLATYSQESVYLDEAGIIFAPFLVYGRESNNLLLKFILSIVFPLVGYLAYFSRARRDWSLILAWLTFGFGAVFTYFFAESGVRLQDANFAWCGQVTLFTLYVATMAFFLKQVFDRRSPYSRIKKPAHFFLCVSVFGLQLLCGLWWYWLHLTQPSNVWW